MRRIKKRVKCLICGEKGIVEISRIRKRIHSKWGYWGNYFIDDKKEKRHLEYWECPKCNK